ncbi:hypothetical protein ADK57_40840 [Streptomyces sp. MMG1533]|uniref:hypothetical protein n=1 Tax=Streptomyces sp. MMG1533 TaxID=1415546 RepID=UPI0006AEF01C|nr:hypothetical protein [Streptomyces sp. MMG1533]KOU56880.1 hypothetical protein ADK57_40840 [Streptomyces sp. MMG1533]
MSTPAGIDLQQQLETLVQDFRASDPPMPVVVLHAEQDSDDHSVVQLVDELYDRQKRHGSRCVHALDGEVPEGDGPTARAVRLVRYLADPKRWGDSSSCYRSYSFPRLNLVRAIHDAADAPEMQEHWSPPDSAGAAAGRRNSAARARTQEQLLRVLAGQRWRPGTPVGRRTRLALPGMQQFVSTGLLGAFTALLTRPEPYVVLVAGLSLMALLLVLHQMPGRAPLFLWLRRESRWFLTTTFLRAAARRGPSDAHPLRPVRSWKAIASRAHDVAEVLREGGEFPLQLYVLALFEDLRDNHRRWSWDLRGFKRSRPPMLFLGSVNDDNGGIALVKAFSDVRSRRSEIDPLLVVASVAVADVVRLEHCVVRDARPEWEPAERLGSRLSRWYEEWAGNLRSGQSPSHEQALPWVLKIPLPADQLEPLERGQERQCVRSGGRLTTARVLWSAHTLVAVLAVVLTTGLISQARLNDTYCATGLMSANHYLKRIQGQCIGIATDGVRFSALDGSATAAKHAEAARPRSLEWLEKKIHEENEEARAHPGKYVTVVYAGPLSNGPGDSMSRVKGIEELAGIYTAQATVNDKRYQFLQVLVANGGADMEHQQQMAELIADYAANDPSVVGVVGLGRDLESSTKVTETLEKAKLPVVSGTNSAGYLARRFSNWFSLAATDEWQVRQLGLVAEQLRGDGGAAPRALVLARNTAEPDRYTREQARYAYSTLVEKKFSVRRAFYELDHGKPKLTTSADDICAAGKAPSVVYFAGRVDELDDLLFDFQESGCLEEELSVLGGDDLAKADFGDGWDGNAARVTLYYAALADLEKAAGKTSFYRLAKDRLGLRGTVGPENQSFSSGQAALAYDATRAMYRAATLKGRLHDRAGTWVNLRAVNLPDMATGRIDFTKAGLYAGHDGHGIVLRKATFTATGESTTRRLCGRPAGDSTPLDLVGCSLDRPTSP